MNRREALAALAAVPAYSLAQPARRARVACLGRLPESSAGGLAKRVESGLAAAGIASVELRFFLAASDDFDVMARNAAEAAAWGPDAILAPGPLHSIAARDATKTIPVVFFAVPDPEAFGLVATLGRPGRNMTGVGLNSRTGTLKRLELAREVLPQARRLVSLYRRRPQAVELLDRVREQVAEAAAGLKFQVEEFDVGAGGRGLRATLAAVAQRPPDALLPFGPYGWESDGSTFDPVDVLVEFERKHRTLVIHDNGEHAVRRGAVVSMYDGGSQLTPAIAVLARVLKGAAPGDIPVAFPLKFLLAVNPDSARALGITLPPAVMIRADVVA